MPGGTTVIRSSLVRAATSAAIGVEAIPAWTSMMSRNSSRSTNRSAIANPSSPRASAQMRPRLHSSRIRGAHSRAAAPISVERAASVGQAGLERHTKVMGFGGE